MLIIVITDILFVNVEVGAEIEYGEIYEAGRRVGLSLREGNRYGTTLNGSSQWVIGTS